LTHQGFGIVDCSKLTSISPGVPAGVGLGVGVGFLVGLGVFDGLPSASVSKRGSKAALRSAVWTPAQW